jgi:hypothetical protein
MGGQLQVPVAWSPERNRPFPLHRQFAAAEAGLKTLKKRLQIFSQFSKWKYFATLLVFKWYSVTSEDDVTLFPLSEMETLSQKTFPLFLNRQSFGLLVCSISVKLYTVINK